MRRKEIKLAVILYFFASTCLAQQKDSFALQLFAEGYSSFLPNKPADSKRPAYHYSYTKANSAGINLALARLHYSSKIFRTNLGVMAGDYPKANLAAEQPWARNIYELNAGFKPLKNHELWIDAGVLPSHIGLESAIGKDNAAATRSILADNSPYYETGVRMSYKPNNQWYIAIFALTGWQRITIPSNQKGTNWGTHITFTPSSNLTINSSSFIGKVFSGTSNLTRIYSNLYSTFTVTEKSALSIVADIGFQENEQTGGKTNYWMGLQALYSLQLQVSA